MRSKIILKRINGRDNQTINVGEEIKRIQFEVNGINFVITPDFDGFRINKDTFSNDESLTIEPGCSNEIIVH